MTATRVLSVAPERYAAWRERFDAANPDGPQRVVRELIAPRDPLRRFGVRVVGGEALQPAVEPFGRDLDDATHAVRRLRG